MQNAYDLGQPRQQTSNRDGSHRRKKHRDEGGRVADTDESGSHRQRRPQGDHDTRRPVENYPDRGRQSANAYRSEFDPIESNGRFANPGEPPRDNPNGRRLRQPESGYIQTNEADENNYINAPYAQNGRFSPNVADEDYNDEQYDDEGNASFDEVYPGEELSVLSDPKQSRRPGPHRVQEPYRYAASGSNFQGSEVTPNGDSVLGYEHQSVADGTPRDLGGDESAFWNPEVEPSDPVLQPHQPESTQAKGLQKFFASIRKKKTPKAKPNALAERNRPASGNTMPTRVIMLDGEEAVFQLDRNEIGQTLLSRVCQSADIVETDYFGLTYVSNQFRAWFWLDLEKKISKQLKGGEEWLFSFQVKFYPPEPTLLQEDITRYQLTLQVRQDIFTGKLPCTWVTQALLGSFMVQAELGDYDERELGDPTNTAYLKEFEFVPHPTPQLLQKIAELHKTHKSMKPNQADVKYLETAKRLELYGVDLHPVRDMDNVDIYVGIGFHGIVIYRDRLRIGRFAWPKVLRISYKKNNFFLKIRPDNSEPVETIIGFRLLNHHLANRLWKAAVEHHAFFRLKEARSPKLHTTIGAQQPFTGHTFFQYRTMNIDRPNPQFDRTLSKRRIASMPMGLNKAASMHSLSRAHPRDMTIGRTQDLNDSGPRRSGGSQQNLPVARHAGSTGQLYGTVPRGSLLSSSKDGRPTPGGRQSSQLDGAGGSVRGASSIGGTRSSHTYMNQPRPAAAADRPFPPSASASVMSAASGRGGAPLGSDISYSDTPRRPSLDSATYGHHRGAAVRSPLYSNVQHRELRGPMQAATPPPPPPANDSSQRSDDPRRFSTGRKHPPAGAVPALGGIMLNAGSPRLTPLRHRPEEVPQPRLKEVIHDPRQGVVDSYDYEEEYEDDIVDDGRMGRMEPVVHVRRQEADDDHSDGTLEYDEEDVDEPVDYDEPRDPRYERRGVPDPRTADPRYDSSRPRYTKPTSHHAPRRSPEATELML